MGYLLSAALRLPSSAMESLSNSSNATANDEETFVRLLAQHEHEVYRYVVSLTFDHSAVDDIMQEVAVALW